VKLLEPAALFALVAVILVAIVYVVRLPFRRRFVVTLPTTHTLAAAAPRRPGWQRHASTVLFLAAIAITVLAFARPAQEHVVPEHLASVIVALDTSNSMRATDVKPQRLEAAQQAVLRFVDEMPRSVQVGVVTFSGTAAVAVPPTSDRSRIRAAVRSVGFGEGTSLGEGIRASITALEQQAADLELTAHRRGRSAQPGPPAAVVLFSDGQQTLGANEAVAVDVARRANVPVSTIAIGTVRGVVTLGSFRVEAPVDRPSLAAVAAATHGHAFVARPGSELAAYDTIAKGLGSTTDTRDFTGWLLVVALGFGAAALVAAFVWNQRVP
jgi:Ca-activated chloride channel family protein